MYICFSNKIMADSYWRYNMMPTWRFWSNSNNKDFLWKLYIWHQRTTENKMNYKAKSILWKSTIEAIKNHD
jgi:hypothetical protein